ncbi:MAG: cyclic nucleotide-binding domain-containing protein, partial [Lachnospiraceae bacterium]|nr:cyclic nucleotide-binding domain-containing protein [Lachnospiraceae bacterium]
RKEKIKLQIAKGKNNSREIFVIDYEQWIKSEAAGGMRLNKVAREILATYCPFNKEIRTALESQPPFAEAVARFNRETQKKVHEVELHFRAIQQKQQVTLPKELEDTLAFYRDK